MCGVSENLVQVPMAAVVETAAFLCKGEILDQ